MNAVGTLADVASSGPWVHHHAWGNFAGHSDRDQVQRIPFSDEPLPLSDILANLALFVGFGFFLGRSLPRPFPKRVGSLILLTAATLSTLVEFS
jgi:hypothetical protein